MRLAVLANVHANSIALDAILAGVTKQRPDQAVVAGDMVNAGVSASDDPAAALGWDRRLRDG
jgi:Icc-related predicted phosphoesterase